MLSEDWIPPEPGETSITVLPCGCVITAVGDTKELQVAPCHMDCVNLQTALGLADERGTPIEYRQAP